MSVLAPVTTCVPTSAEDPTTVWAPRRAPGWRRARSRISHPASSSVATSSERPPLGPSICADSPTSTSSQIWTAPTSWRSEEHTSELQSRGHLVCRLLLEKKNTFTNIKICNIEESLKIDNGYVR